MKLLLDENLPRKLKLDFTEHQIFTVRDKGWNGFKNGELQRLMLAEGFDVLLTFDKNLQHQQNFGTFPVAVVVLTARSNQYKHVRPLIGQIKIHLAEPKPGVTVIAA